MSFCAHGPRSSTNCVALNVLRTTANRLRTVIQGWIACFLGTAWMSCEAMFDCAQSGSLLYPLGLIEIHYPGNIQILMRIKRQFRAKMGSTVWSTQQDRFFIKP